VVVGIAQNAAAHLFEVVLDLHDAGGVVRQRIHFDDIGLDAVEFRDGIDGQRHRDEHEKCESGIELGLDRHRHSLKSVRRCYCAMRVPRIGGVRRRLALESESAFAT
jgi:hypothetical protein